MINDQAKQLFNEGVTASLTVGELIAASDVEGARTQSELAIDRFRGAVEIDPESSTFTGALGHELYVHASMFGAGDFGEAADCLLEAIQTEPDNVPLSASSVCVEQTWAICLQPKKTLTACLSSTIRMKPGITLQRKWGISDSVLLNTGHHFRRRGRSRRVSPTRDLQSEH